jgi:predicted MFS family arabinose efflux permease
VRRNGSPDWEVNSTVAGCIRPRLQHAASAWDRRATRGGSAMNMIVIFAAQAAAASVAGVLITRFGHPPVLTVAALLFAGLRSERIAPSDS